MPIPSLTRRAVLAAVAGLAFVPCALAGASLSSGTSLERALDAVRADRIQADVEFLASDELGGRDTPSEGLRMAARFVRARLVRLGWQPGAEDGYFHYYDLASRRIDEGATRASVERAGETAALALGEDYWFYAQGVGDAEVSGPVVFCGAGEEEQLQSAELEGRWALCVDGDVHWRRRERWAQEAGAIGVVVAAGPDYDDDPYPERFERHLSRARRTSVSWPQDGGEERELFPQTFLSEAAARRAFPEVFGGQPPAVGTLLDATFTDARALIGGGLVQLENVCGFWQGSDPELSKEVILLSAHYDHVGERETGEIYNGADDNASGSAALLAVAEALAQYGPMRRSVMLIWVSGEEKGLYGSKAWTLDPWLPGDARPFCNLNIDMVGRNAPDSLLITPTAEREEYNGLVRLAEAGAPVEGFGPLGSADAYWGRSDHANFAQNLAIPVAFLFSDVHEDYHRPTDTADKIDADKIRRVSRLIVRMLEGLQEADLDL